MPSVGVTNVGLLENTNDPDPVSFETTVVRLGVVGFPKKFATPAANPLIPVLTGRPVALVNVTDEGVPRAGVMNVGLLAKTSEPEPVESETDVWSIEEEMELARVP